MASEELAASHELSSALRWQMMTYGMRRVSVPRRNRANPHWYEDHRVHVFKMVPRTSTAAPPGQEVPELLRLLHQRQATHTADGLPDDMCLCDDGTDCYRICGTETVVCSAQPRYQFGSFLAAAQVAHLLQTTHLAAFAQLLRTTDGVRVALERRPGAADTTLIDAWFESARQVILDHLASGSLTLQPGVHGSVFYHGSIRSLTDLLATDVYVSVVPLTQAVDHKLVLLVQPLGDIVPMDAVVARRRAMDAANEEERRRWHAAIAARQTREADERRLAEAERRAEREGRRKAEPPAPPPPSPRTTTTNHKKKKKKKQDGTSMLEKLASIAAAATHERELERREAARVQQLVDRVELVRLGDAIGRGE